MSGCGGSSSDKSDTIVGGADPDTVQVIKKWADELRAGDVTAASQRFALPTVIQNGTPALTLTSRGQVEAFNRSLPCGARLTAAVSTGRFTVATFVLTERPGPGECGDGVGEAAKTAFVVRDGLITQWRRVVDTAPESTGTGPVV
jgi:limonene-1,2-epoxide hydrolase